MTVSYIGDGLYVGLNSDTKPTAPAGYRFFETDMGDTLVSDGTYWWLTGMPSLLSTRKVGYFPHGLSGSTGVGLLSNMSSPTGTGTINFAIDGTNGRYTNLPTGTTTGNKGGLKTGTAVSARGFNVKSRIRFILSTTTDTRLYLGYTTNSSDRTGDDPLNSTQGVMFGMSTSSSTSATNWLTMHNTGGGTNTIIENTGTAFDGSLHTLSLVADDTNSKFAWKLDGANYVDITTDIPASSTALYFFIQNETATNSASTIRVYEAVIQSDK